MRRNETRTTVTLKEEHRAILHVLAARRGLRGYSRIIAEALDFYFSHAPEVSRALKELATPSKQPSRKAEPSFPKAG